MCHKCRIVNKDGAAVCPRSAQRHSQSCRIFHLHLTPSQTYNTRFKVHTLCSLPQARSMWPAIVWLTRHHV